MIKKNEKRIFKILLILSLITNNIEKDYFINKRINKFQNMKTNTSFLKIFIMAHKDFNNCRYNPVYHIVVDDKSQLKKKYNLNIIYTNEGKLLNMTRAYGEMSKLYFIYQLYKNKKMSSKYVGLNHYRRYFIFGDNIPYLDYIFENHDVILNKPYRLKRSIMREYCISHICKNFVEVLNIIKDIKPKYFKTALKTANKKKIHYCNLFIMKKEDFFHYCEFVFDILFEFDRRNNFTSDRNVFEYTKNFFNNTEQYYFQSRLQGFLSERISNIFFNQYFKRIKTFSLENI